ncbi:hypothetical protein F5Y17DRAFT_419905 [Xylariaceae sp. FL0594]|nr:hypothetical protein F5Y17DRAFT_419905 [Xylariaceae sp. FL0594]
MTLHAPVKDHQVRNEMARDLARLLDTASDDLQCFKLGSYSETFKELYEATLKDGLKSLLGTVSHHEPAWEDAMMYAREVIMAPQDTERRAASLWARSCSEVVRELVKRFGPATIKAARRGAAAVVADHFGGDKRSVAHVNKKASYLRHREELTAGAAFYPQSSPLANGCHSIGTLACSLAVSAFLPIDQAVQVAFLSHLSVCDDYGSFTHEDYDVRLRMVALAAGAAYQRGGRMIGTLIDGTLLQAVGTADESTARTVEAAMAWRAVSGCTSIFSRYNFFGGDDDLDDDGLIAITAMICAHDLFDWRSDVAAGNHENGISAVYGLSKSAASPFHVWLETMLGNVASASQPREGLYAIGAMTYMHFTVVRYSAWEYEGEHGPACEECTRLVREITSAASLRWAPKPPPKSYADGEEAREWGRLWTDHLLDRGIMQEAVGWFQYLISTGRIWLFDALARGTRPVDDDADWV